MCNENSHLVPVVRVGLDLSAVGERMKGLSSCCKTNLTLCKTFGFIIEPFNFSFC